MLPGTRGRLVEVGDGRLPGLCQHQQVPYAPEQAGMATFPGTGDHDRPGTQFRGDVGEAGGFALAEEDPAGGVQ